MKIRYIFSDGTILESIPGKTTLSEFSRAVRGQLRHSEITDIQFVEAAA